ncbi:hypothetical protein ON010_g10028 [Phytophthora cinnamomi]|nr:hypothetical protein ON010_g10028 [Phytophthora cinnamomi]
MPLVLSQLARIGVPFSVMYLMQPQGSTIPYFVFRVVDNGFGTAGVLGAAVADIIPIQHRAGAFGILSASVAIGYCTSAFIAAFFSRCSDPGTHLANFCWAFRSANCLGTVSPA